MFLLVSIFNAVAILTGLISLRKGGPVILYLALLIIGLALVNEHLLVLNSWNWWGLHHNIFYNLYSMAEIVIWLSIYHLLFNKIIRRVILFCGTVILIYSLYEILFAGSQEQFHTKSYTLFSVASLLLSLLYISTISFRDHHPLTRDPAFYLCAAAVCFHSIFLLNLVTVLNAHYWEQSGAAYIFDTLQSLATCTYHLLICIAFIIFSCKQSNTSNHRALC